MGSKLNPNCDVYWVKRKCWFSSNQTEEWYLDYFPYEGTDWLLIKEKDRITKFDN
jgi:hypothetical protein